MSSFKKMVPGYSGGYVAGQKKKTTFNHLGTLISARYTAWN